MADARGFRTARAEDSVCQGRREGHPNTKGILPVNSKPPRQGRFMAFSALGVGMVPGFGA